VGKKQVKLAGNFVEQGWNDIGAPSLVEQRGKRPAANKERVVAYLKAGVAFVVSPGFDEDFFAPPKTAAVSTIRTDGEYAWPSALAYYVENYDVGLSPDFEAHMQRNQWKVPDKIDPRSLELPPAPPET
jgi:hypothetical protein